MSLSVVIFDVGRGLCIAIRSPLGHLILIDCGRSDSYSPSLDLASLSRFWTGRNGYPLTELIVTHPHTDHIADIEHVTKILPPSMILRRTDFDWTKVLSGRPSSSALSHYLGNYHPPNYNCPIPPQQYPEWGDGMILWSTWLNAPAASEVSISDSEYVNNMSIVTILEYCGYTFAFPGDIETKGMDTLLAVDLGLRGYIGRNKDLWGNPVGGVDFLVASHHGHSSGFSTAWFDWTGPTRIFNIVSERSLRRGEDPKRVQVDRRYSDDAHCLARNREGRRMISTRQDGHIFITIHDDRKWEWSANK